jgi:hypothetical protein
MKLDNRVPLNHTLAFTTVWVYLAVFVVAMACSATAVAQVGPRSGAVGPPSFGPPALSPTGPTVAPSGNPAGAPAGQAVGPPAGPAVGPPASPAVGPPASPAVGPPAGTPVALLNLGQVFQYYSRFQAAFKELQNDAQNLDAKYSLHQKQLAELNERLKTYKPGTPEYKHLESQIAQVAAQGQADLALNRRELLNREVKLYYDAYLEISQETAAFARQHQIAVVLVYNGDPINAEDRQSIVRGVNRAVVYQRGLDITAPILERLNRGVAPPSVSNRPIIPQRR